MFVSLSSARPQSSLTSLSPSPSTSFAKNPKRTTSAAALSDAGGKKGASRQLGGKSSSMSFRTGGFS